MISLASFVRSHKHGAALAQSRFRGTLELVCARSGGLTGNSHPLGGWLMSTSERPGEPAVTGPSFAATDHLMAMTTRAHDRACLPAGVAAFEAGSLQRRP